MQVSELEFTVISGHTMLSGAVYPLAFCLSLQSASRHYATWGAISGFLFSALIGISRVATAAHSPSEVIAGWILGSAVSLVMLVQLRQSGQRVRSSVAFSTGVITIVWICYGHLAPIQGWIEDAAPSWPK
ncbi:hypothetical protein AU476_15030 [Cupriavidus sp. UYMSc13B]|nr:hypothetical protein AU476_15030 [Cupriavidus sp. UYMSc13B]